MIKNNIIPLLNYVESNKYMNKKKIENKLSLLYFLNLIIRQNFADLDFCLFLKGQGLARVARLQNVDRIDPVQHCL